MLVGQELEVGHKTFTHSLWPGELCDAGECCVISDNCVASRPRSGSVEGKLFLF